MPRYLVETAMEWVIVAVVGWLVYREWQSGRITLPLNGHETLVRELSDFVLAHPMIPYSIITDAERARGAIIPGELADFVRSKLRDRDFPRARLHDLRKTVCKVLRRDGTWYAASQEGYVMDAFNQLAERQDAARSQWA